MRFVTSPDEYVYTQPRSQGLFLRGEKALASAGHVTNLHPAEVGVLFFGGLSQPFAYESDLL